MRNMCAPAGPPVIKPIANISFNRKEELLAANAPSSFAASSPFDEPLVHVLPLSLVSQSVNLPLTGSPNRNPSLSKRLISIASQKPSGSGLVKMSFQELHPSVVL